MKKKTLFASVIVATVASTLASCLDSEKNLYDSSFQMPNPMGENFSAPNDFDWSMTSAQTINVEVKDEFAQLNAAQGNNYYYLIEFYDKNPLYNQDAMLLGKGVARKDNNLVTTINLPKSLKGLYIKQTDPKNRVEIYLFAIPEDNKEITCKLYYSNAKFRSLANNTIASTRGIPFEKPNYTSIPPNAQELSQVQGNLQPNASYKITSPYNGTFSFYGNNNGEQTKLYVASIWTIPANFTFQKGIEIIVMPTGTIETTQTLTFVNESMMTIMDSGRAKINNITFTDAIPAGLRNWGDLSVTNELILSDGASLYNKGTMASKKMRVNSNSIIVNDHKIAIEDAFELPSLFNLENNGELTARKMTASSGAIITNNGKMKFESINWTNPEVYNNCYIEATTSLELNGAKLFFNKGYLKATTIKSIGGSLKLDNGSMLEATQSSDFKETNFMGTSNTTSMIKSPIIAGQDFIYDGNVVIESNNHVEKNPWWDNFEIRNGAYITSIGQSKITIETCNGTVNDGNQGGEPSAPDFPIEINDQQNYTYIFEDQWPLYGDYDMNDIVIIIRNRKLFINQENKVSKFELSIDLCAVGATRKLGAAIMLDAVKAEEIQRTIQFENNSIPQSFNLNNRNIENGQVQTVVPLFDDAHKALNSTSYSIINTLASSPNNTNEVKNVKFTIEFDNPTLSANAFNIDKMNVFIIANGNKVKRREIHVAGFQPSQLIETSVFGGNNDNSSFSSKRFYISKENLAWGVMIPTDLKWPREYINIKDAYPMFETWVTSGGKENEKWWNDFDVNKVFQIDKK